MTETRPRGRPTNPDAIRRWPAINVNLPPEVFARYRLRSNASGVPVSEIVREILVSTDKALVAMAAE